MSSPQHQNQYPYAPDQYGPTQQQYTQPQDKTMPPGGGNNHEYYNPGYIGQQGGDPQAPSSSPYHGAADVEKHGAAEQAAVKAPLIVLGGSPDRAPKKKFTILGRKFAKRTLIIVGVIVLVVLIIIIGVGVGLGTKNKKKSGGSSRSRGGRGGSGGSTGGDDGEGDSGDLGDFEFDYDGDGTGDIDIDIPEDFDLDGGLDTEDGGGDFEFDLDDDLYEDNEVIQNIK